MCSHCSLFTSDALASSLLQRTLDNGAAQPLQPPSSRLRHSFYGLEKSKSDKQGCIWLISLSAVMSCLTFQRLPLLLSVLPVVFLRRGLPAPQQPISVNLILRFARLIPCTQTAQGGVIIGTPLISVSSYSALNG